MKSGSLLDGRYGQTNFHSNPTKNAPKCIIFIFKIQKFFSGEGHIPSPHPTPSAPRFSHLRCSMGPPKKILGTGLVFIHTFHPIKLDVFVSDSHCTDGLCCNSGYTMFDEKDLYHLLPPSCVAHISYPSVLSGLRRVADPI
jgi:hypothetical protein